MSSFGTQFRFYRFLDSGGVISVLMGGGSTSAVGYSGFGSGIKLNGPRGVAVDYSVQHGRLRDRSYARKAAEP